MKTLNYYQEQARKFDIYKGNMSITHNVLKLVGESGEIAEKLGKLMRDRDIDDFNSLSDDIKLELVKELGDVLWYIARLSEHLGYTLAQTAQINMDKLQSRKDRGKLKGSGDNR